MGGPGKARRRDFLYYATASTGAVATGVAIWPLIDSMNPSADVISQSTLVVDLADVAVGSRITVSWAGKPVFVWRRSPEIVAMARSTSLDDLPDPVDGADENPNNNEDMPALDENRSADEAGEWLIVIGICTHLGCVPLGEAGDFGGWFCPCHGSHYDNSGRIRKGPAPENLWIPVAEFISDTAIRLG